MTSKHWMGLMTLLLGLIAIAFMVLFFNTSQDLDQNQTRLSNLQNTATRQFEVAAAAQDSAQASQTAQAGVINEQAAQGTALAATATQAAAQSEGDFQNLAATATQAAAQSENAFQGLAATATKRASQNQQAFQDLAATSTQAANAQAELQENLTLAQNNLDVLEAQATTNASIAQTSRYRLEGQENTIATLEAQTEDFPAQIATLESNYDSLAFQATFDAERAAEDLATAQSQAATPTRAEAAAPNAPAGFQSQTFNFASSPIEISLSFPAAWEARIDTRLTFTEALMVSNNIDQVNFILDTNRLSDDEGLLIVFPLGDLGTGFDLNEMLEFSLEQNAEIETIGPIENYETAVASVARSEVEISFGDGVFYAMEQDGRVVLVFYVYNGSKESALIGDEIVESIRLR